MNLPDPAFVYPEPPPTVIDTEFVRSGRRWRVSVVTNTFIIATATDALLDKHGEPSRLSDVIRIILPL